MTDISPIHPPIHPSIDGDVNELIITKAYPDEAVQAMAVVAGCAISSAGPHWFITDSAGMSWYVGTKEKTLDDWRALIGSVIDRQARGK